MMLTEERKNELKDSYLRIAERIENAAAKRGSGGKVTLLAASKTRPAEDITYLMTECGLRLCGENHAQEFRDKYPEIIKAGGQMDFIGHLQSNKIKYVAGKAGLIHSVDSIRLAGELDSFCKKKGITQNILIEVNVGDEENKTGLPPYGLDEFLDECAGFSSLVIKGMMAMTPICEKKTDYCKYFANSYRFFLDFFVKKTHNSEEMILSMGMSDSFEEAISEGATMVRIGSSLFGARDYQNLNKN